MSPDELPEPGLMQPSHDTDRADAGREAKSRRGATRGHPAELPVAELEALAADLVRRVGAERARFVATLLEEAAEAAEGRA
jgi:hypothetical protein